MILAWVILGAAALWALTRLGRQTEGKGRGQWRVEASELEAYIQRAYAQTREFVDEHPFVES